MAARKKSVIVQKQNQRSIQLLPRQIAEVAK